MRYCVVTGTDWLHYFAASLSRTQRNKWKWRQSHKSWCVYIMSYTPFEWIMLYVSHLHPQRKGDVSYENYQQNISVYYMDNLRWNCIEITFTWPEYKTDRFRSNIKVRGGKTMREWLFFFFIPHVSSFPWISITGSKWRTTVTLIRLRSFFLTW